MQRFQCVECNGRVFGSETAYQSHLKGASKHKPYQCPMSRCDGGFNAVIRLQLHFAKKHPGLRVFNCTSCTAAFVEENALRNHFQTKHSEVHLDPNDLIPQLTIRPQKNCEICVHSVYEDQWRQHVEDSVKHKLCPHCDNHFESLEAYRLHASVPHLPSTCTTCGLRFPTAELLNKHLEYAADHYSCTICGQRYSADWILSNHMRISHWRSFYSRVNTKVTIAKPTTLKDKRLTKQEKKKQEEARRLVELEEQRQKAILSTIETTTFASIGSNLASQVTTDLGDIKDGSSQEGVVLSDSPISAPPVYQVPDDTHDSSSGVLDNHRPVSLAAGDVQAVDEAFSISVSIPSTGSMSPLSDQVLIGKEAKLATKPNISNDTLATLDSNIADDHDGCTTVCPVSDSPAVLSHLGDNHTTEPVSDDPPEPHASDYVIVHSEPKSPDSDRNTSSVTIAETAPPSTAAFISSSFTLACGVCAQSPPTAPLITMCGHIFCHRCILATLTNSLHCPTCGWPIFVKLQLGGNN